jgi:hypothetical protein
MSARAKAPPGSDPTENQVSYRCAPPLVPDQDAYDGITYWYVEK